MFLLYSPFNSFNSLGTSVPAGLHVRHNFETGVTEAKLMDGNDLEEEDSNKILNSTNTNSLTLHPENAILEEKDHVPAEKTDLFNYSIEELKDRLKKMKQEGEDFPEIDVTTFNYSLCITHKEFV